MRARGNLLVHDELYHLAGREEVEFIEGNMSRPKARYSVVVKDHATGERLKVELIELPFSDGRRFRVRVNVQCNAQAASGEQDHRRQAAPGLAGEALKTKGAPLLKRCASLERR